VTGTKKIPTDADTPPESSGSSTPSQSLENIVVVLYEPQNLINIAGCIRAMMNFGLSRLRIVKPAEFSAYRIAGIAHRSESMIAATEIFETLDEALADVTWAMGTTARARTAARNYGRPREIADDVLTAAETGVVAILFGREDRGLPNEALDRCNRVAIVPTDSEYSSLNLAQACLLVCYELFYAAEDHRPLPRGKRDMGPASHQDLEEMYEALEAGLGRIGFYKGARKPASIIRTIRTLLARARPDLREAKLLRAIGFEIGNVARRSEKEDPAETADSPD
jgi:tRNA/rRNA methyltransferase